MKETLYCVATVGRHNRVDKSPVHQDGFISAILHLVLFIGLSLSIVLSQYLSEQHGAQQGESMFSIATEAFLILVLVPGFFTIIYAFAKDGLRLNQPLGDLSSFENLELYGLYIFGSCSVVFDIFSFVCEAVCLPYQENSADSIVDMVFYLFKLLFTLCQCLFIKSFHKSYFDSKPLLQVSLVSIIAANMAIWLYTTIGKYMITYSLLCNNIVVYYNR